MPTEHLVGDCREVLKTLEPDSVQLCLTSPPYFGLRDYGTATWQGGDAGCDHKIPSNEHDHKKSGNDGESSHVSRFNREKCYKCGATRIDAQIGLEPTLDAYVTDLVTVFREVRRVLKPSGVLVLNLGDSYMGGGGGNYNKTGVNNAGGQHVTNVRNRPDFIKSNGVKPKDLCMVPARVALALQADGWWLRSMIPWVKRNCLSGGAWLYARTQKGDMPVMLKDLVRLNPETVKLWDGVKWNQVVSWTPADVTERTGLLEIELRSGERIGCTGEHRFPTERGLLHARDMKVGDVLTKVTLPQPDCVVMPPNMDDSFGWLVGMYLAEGHKQGNGIILSGHVKEQHRTDILRGFANLFGADVRVHGNGNTNAATWHITSRVLRAIIDTYIGGHDAKDKHLTSACWQRSNAFLDRVLAGYLEGDGHYDAANNRWRLGFTANDGLARDLRTLCARLGYSIRLKRSKVTAIKDGTEFKSYRGEIRIEMYRGSTSTQFQPKRNTEIVAIRASRVRHYWDVELADDPHVFALASGVLTHNSLPESVTDRPSSAVEYIFILAKSKSYYWDGEAVKRPNAAGSVKWGKSVPSKTAIGQGGKHGSSSFFSKVISHDEVVWRYCTNGRSYRNSDAFFDSIAAIVNDKEQMLLLNEDDDPLALLVNPKPFKDSHFAVFPPMLVEPFIKAATSERGNCAKCGKPWKRIVKRNDSVPDSWKGSAFDDGKNLVNHPNVGKRDQAGRTHSTNEQRLGKEPVPETGWQVLVETTGWEPTCDCNADTVPCVVLDPFGGSGTVGMVAEQLGRDAILIDLNPKYVEMQVKRIESVKPAEKTAPKIDGYEQLRLM